MAAVMDRRRVGVFDAVEGADMAGRRLTAHPLDKSRPLREPAGAQRIVQHRLPEIAGRHAVSIDEGVGAATVDIGAHQGMAEIWYAAILPGQPVRVIIVGLDQEVVEIGALDVAVTAKGCRQEAVAQRPVCAAVLAAVDAEPPIMISVTDVVAPAVAWPQPLHVIGAVAVEPHQLVCKRETAYEIGQAGEGGLMADVEA